MRKSRKRLRDIRLAKTVEILQKLRNLSFLCYILLHWTEMDSLPFILQRIMYDSLFRKYFTYFVYSYLISVQHHPSNVSKNAPKPICIFALECIYGVLFQKVDGAVQKALNFQLETRKSRPKCRKCNEIERKGYNFRGHFYDFVYFLFRIKEK